jgi:hypothetical protein
MAQPQLIQMALDSGGHNAIGVAGGFRCRSPRRTPTRGRGPSSPRRLGSGSSRRSRNGSFHDRGVRT